MCNPASFIVTRNEVYWSTTSDRHEDIIEERKLRERVGGKMCLIRVELTPPDSDFRVPLDQWRFRVDQDKCPQWHDDAPDKTEQRVRAAAVGWLKSKVVLPGEKRDKVGDKQYVLMVYGEIRDVCGSAQIGYVCGSAKIRDVYGSAQIGDVRDSAQIRYVRGSAQIRYVCGSAQIGDVCGSAQIGDVCGSAQIGDVCGSARIGDVYDSARIANQCGRSTVRTSNAKMRPLLSGPYAVLIDVSGERAVCIVGE